MRNFLVLAFLFAAGGTVGWGLEVIYRRFFSQKHWVNPGYLTGPCLPLYGMSLCVLYVLSSSESYIPVNYPLLRKIILFLLMALAITMIEFVVGIVGLKITKVRLWDYTNHKGNIYGVVCPLYSFYWSILSAIYYFLVDPYISNALEKLIEGQILPFCLGLYYGIFMVDLAYSASLMAKIRKFAHESRIVIRLEELREDIYNAVKEYGKPSFLLSLRPGVPLRETLERYRDKYINSDIIMEKLNLNIKKGK